MTPRKTVKTLARRCYARALGASSVLVPGLRHDRELRWFILLTMPNSGSTAMAGVLRTAPATTGLTHKCEGEWLIPALSDRASAWDPDHAVSAAVVRARWIRAARATKPPGTTVVIEKSPPNMVRRAWLTAALAPMPVRFFALVRNPYAVCASWLENYGWSNRSLPRRPIDDGDLCEMLGALYARRLAFLEDAVRSGVPFMRYEDWASDPSTLVEAVTTVEPMLRGFDPCARVGVKGATPAPPADMNHQHLSRLDPASSARITAGLRPATRALERFGYETRD